MKQDLEKRLVSFAAAAIKLTKNLRKESTSKILTEQIIRSATSCALNYGETQNAESKKDFIHKASIVLKELRETSINLQLIHSAELYQDEVEIKSLLKENDELLAIFTATILTAKKNLKKESAV